MAGTRIDKYRKYRESIAARADNIPVLKTPSTHDEYADEAGFFKKITIKNRIITLFILFLVVVIIALLIIFGIIVF